MKTARHEKLKSRGDRLLLGGGCLFEQGKNLMLPLGKNTGVETMDRQGREMGRKEAGGI